MFYTSKKEAFMLSKLYISGLVVFISILSTLTISDDTNLQNVQQTQIPHIRQNTDLLVKWYYQIQGGLFMFNKKTKSKLTFTYSLQINNSSANRFASPKTGGANFKLYNIRKIM